MANRMTWFGTPVKKAKYDPHGTGFAISKSAVSGRVSIPGEDIIKAGFATCANIEPHMLVVPTNLFDKFNALMKGKEAHMNARIHRDRDGLEMLVAEMDDEHLVNTIIHWVSKLKKAQIRLDRPAVTGFQKLVYQFDDMKDEDWAMQQIEQFFLFAPRYFLEAMIRGITLDHVIKELRGILGRKGRLMPVSGLLSTPEDYDEDMDPDDYSDDPDDM